MTKIDKDLTCAASNLISILNIGKVALNEKDLSGVRICGAYLRGAILNRTNFERADLSHVELSNSFIKQTSFKNATMKGVNFRVYAYLEGHEGAVRCVAYSPDGKNIASASDDKSIRFWDVASGKQIGEALKGHYGAVLCVAYSQNGKIIASASEDSTIRLYDA
jgi:WD40 repeat protein